MPYACKFCIAAKGLEHAQIASLPKTFEEAAEHVEREHRYPVRRPGESQDEAEHRVFMAYQKTLWHADYALEQALGGPNVPAAALIEASGAVVAVNEPPGAIDVLTEIRVGTGPNGEPIITVKRDPHSMG